MGFYEECIRPRMARRLRSRTPSDWSPLTASDSSEGSSAEDTSLSALSLLEEETEEKAGEKEPDLLEVLRRRPRPEFSEFAQLLNVISDAGLQLQLGSRLPTDGYTCACKTSLHVG